MKKLSKKDQAFIYHQRVFWFLYQQRGFNSAPEREPFKHLHLLGFLCCSRLSYAGYTFTTAYNKNWVFWYIKKYEDVLANKGLSSDITSV